MHRRINITLPEETVRLLDRIAGKGERSRVIAEAVTRYVTRTGREQLRKQVKEGALRHAERDRKMAQEWFALEEEGWHDKKKR